MNGLLLGIVGNALGSRLGQLKRRKHREQADGALALGIAAYQLCKPGASRSL